MRHRDPARAAVQPPHWMTRAEAAAYARVSTRTVDRARRCGDLIASRVAGFGRYRYRRVDLDRWLGAGAHLRVVGVA